MVLTTLILSVRVRAEGLAAHNGLNSSLSRMFYSLPPGVAPGVLHLVETAEFDSEYLEHLTLIAAASDTELASGETVHPSQIDALARKIERLDGDHNSLFETTQRLFRIQAALSHYLGEEGNNGFDEVRGVLRQRLSAQRREALDRLSAPFESARRFVRDEGPTPVIPGGGKVLRLEFPSSRHSDPKIPMIPGPTDVHFRLDGHDNMPYRYPISRLDEEHPAVAHRLRAIFHGAGLDFSATHYTWLDHSYDLTDARTLVNKQPDTLVIIGPEFSSPFGIYSAGPIVLWDAETQLVAARGPIVVVGHSFPKFTLDGPLLLVDRSADLREAQVTQSTPVSFFGNRPKSRK